MGDSADDLDRHIERLLHHKHDYSTDVIDTWIKRDGTKIKIKDMTDSHIKTTIEMLNRNNPSSKYLPFLKHELSNRK